LSVRWQCVALSLVLTRFSWIIWAESDWYTQLDNTKWLHTISTVLSGGIQIAELLERGSPVLTHCSDGYVMHSLRSLSLSLSLSLLIKPLTRILVSRWDRTSQIVSIAQLILDPYYRTLRGFEVLIEKEWLSFGHMFSARSGHGGLGNAGDISPIFTVFIDCVWQIVQQYPCSFEFNERFLLTVLDELFYCRFGTFLYNNERERVAAQLKQRTISLWSMINSNAVRFRNPHYRPNSRRLSPSASMRRLSLWTGYYLRWTSFQHTKESVSHVTRKIVAERELLQRQLCDLREAQSNSSMNTPDVGSDDTTDDEEDEAETERVHVDVSPFSFGTDELTVNDDDDNDEYDTISNRAPNDAEGASASSSSASSQQNSQSVE